MLNPDQPRIKCLNLGLDTRYTSEVESVILRSFPECVVYAAAVGQPAHRCPAERRRQCRPKRALAAVLHGTCTPCIAASRAAVLPGRRRGRRGPEHDGFV